MKELFRAGTWAAVVAVAALAMMAFTRFTYGAGLELQPSYPAAPAADFVAVINGYPGDMLRFFAADSLFVLSYLIVFATLYGLAAQRVSVLAAIGLTVGGLAALLDATENIFFISFATLAMGGTPVSVGELPLGAIYMIGGLKWMAAFAAFIAFGPALPRHDLLDRVVVWLMLVFPLTGVLAVAWPALAPVPALLMLVGMVLFAFYFRKQGRKVTGQ